MSNRPCFSVYVLALISPHLLKYPQAPVKTFHCNIMVTRQQNYFSGWVGQSLVVPSLWTELRLTALACSTDPLSLIFYFMLSTATKVNTELQSEKWFQFGNWVLHSEYKNAGSCICLLRGGVKRKKGKEIKINKMKIYFSNALRLSKAIGVSALLDGTHWIWK